MNDVSLMTPEMIAAFLLDPTKVGPGIYLLIEQLDEKLSKLGGISGRTKLFLAWGLSFLAPIGGVAVRVWLGLQSLDPTVLVALIVAIANVTLSITIHDTLDKLDSPKTEATAEAMKAEMERIVTEKMVELFDIKQKEQADVTAKGAKL